jgi:hypothetical protein
MDTRLPSLLLPAFALSLMLATLLAAGSGGARAGTCASPAPTCTSSGTFPSGGNFRCTQVQTDSNGVVKVGLLLLTISASTGTGTFTGEIIQNSNDANQTTTFGKQAVSGNYCINTDNTGVIIPADVTACALVFALDNSGSEMRVIESGEQKAATLVCRKE